MATKPQDIVVALTVCLSSVKRPYADMAKLLGMSASEVHAGVRRLIEARLLDPETNQIRREVFCNFLIHGVPYAFPTKLGEVTRGIPTAWAAPVLASRISSNQLPPVWPHPEGQAQGTAVRPLYTSVPGAAERDPELYDLLALVDTLRLGRARERAMAEKEILRRIKPQA
jgi:DNA-binding Lrp family transcriptional regulator